MTEDIRLRGFTARAPFDEALAWIDAHAAPLGGETVGILDAAGRVLAEPAAAPAPLPARDRAARDGYALNAAATVGAGGYAPVTLHLTDGPVTAGAARLVAAGEPLPAGADAVLPVESAEKTGDAVAVLATIAQGSNIERRGEDAAAGAVLLPAGRRLRPGDLALLAALGLDRVTLVRRPRVRLVVIGPPAAAGTADANSPMLRALVARDGGVLESCRRIPAARDEIGTALIEPGVGATGADLVVAVGATGAGAADEAPPALAEAGTLDIHGVALRPAGSTALGSVGGVPVLLLPGNPAACLCAWDLLAGRAVRVLAGRGAALPYPALNLPARRKIISRIGSVDWCRVRRSGNGVEPVASGASTALLAQARADGFVLVPASHEGYATGTPVTVYLYQDQVEGAATAP